MLHTLPHIHRPESQISWEARDPSEMLKKLSEPWGPGDRVKTAIDRAAKRAGLNYWRAWDIWYRKARRVEEQEVTQIAAALKVKNETIRDEIDDLKQRLERLEARLSAGDAAQISQWRQRRTTSA